MCVPVCVVRPGRVQVDSEKLTSARAARALALAVHVLALPPRLTLVHGGNPVSSPLRTLLPPASESLRLSRAHTRSSPASASEPNLAAV
eukprot:1446764-Rhodomonas_salina.1